MLNIYKISVVYNLLLGKVSHVDQLVMNFIEYIEENSKKFVKIHL